METCPERMMSKQRGCEESLCCSWTLERQIFLVLSASHYLTCAVSFRSASCFLVHRNKGWQSWWSSAASLPTHVVRHEGKLWRSQPGGFPCLQLTDDLLPKRTDTKVTKAAGKWCQWWKLKRLGLAWSALTDEWWGGEELQNTKENITGLFLGGFFDAYMLETSTSSDP